MAHRDTAAVGSDNSTFLQGATGKQKKTKKNSFQSLFVLGFNFARGPQTMSEGGRAILHVPMIRFARPSFSRLPRVK